MSKELKSKALTKNTLLFGISSFGTKFLSFFLVYIYTKELTTAEYGIVDVITTTVQLLIPLLTINIQDAVLRFGLDDNYKPADVINIGFRLLCYSSIVLGLVVGLLYKFSIINLGANYWIFLYISFICGGCFNILSMYLKTQNEVKTLAIWGLLNTVITFGANILLLSVFHIGINGYIIATISGTLISNLGMFFSGKVWKDIKQSKYSKSLLILMLAYSSPLIANSLGWWINTASDRYILTFISGAAVNGIYAVSYKIPSILSAVQSVFYNAWSISAIKEFDKNDSDGFIGSVYSTYALGSMLIASIIMGFNVCIAKILYSNEFFNAWKYVPILLTGTVFNGLGLFEGCIFTAVKKTKEVSLTTVLGALINTILNFLLIPLFGAIGAAVATMIGYISIWFIRTYKLRNIIKMKANWKVQITCIVILIAQSIIATINNTPYLQIPFFIMILFFGRKNYYSIFSKSLVFLKKRFKL